MHNRVQDKVCIVTGSTSGIGEGIARLLAAEGGKVVVSGRREERGKRVVEEIEKGGGEAIFVRADVSQEADCQALIAAAVQRWGRLDVLVNNAGIFPRASLEEVTPEHFYQIVGINLLGPIMCCKYAVPLLRAQGGGSIVNIGSMNGYSAAHHLIAYGASKGGLLNLTRTLARHLAKDKIRVNWLTVGWVITEMEIEIQEKEGHSEQWLIEQGQKLPLGRMQTAEDIAYGVLYLASDESSQVTAQELHVTGGALMGM